MERKRYIIATQNGYLDDEFTTRAAAVKALAQEVKAAAARCRRSYTRCSVIGTAKKGSVVIRIGGRQSCTLWQRYVIKRSPGFWG